MALKFKLKSKDEVPAELVNLYVERDGAWHLDVEGAVDKAKLEEFRATNVTLMKERDELKQRFEGIDPDEVRKLAGEKRKLEEARALRAATTAGEVEKLIEARVRAVKGDLDKKLASATSERAALKARLTEVQIDRAILIEATNAVWTYADDWLSYPDLPRRKKWLNAATGGWDGIVNHHLWWMRRIPHAAGTTDGFHNNWWQYIVNYDEAMRALPPPGATFQKAAVARYAE